MKAVFFNMERFKELWNSNVKVVDIAAELGISTSNVSAQAKRLNLPSRRERAENDDYICAEAKARDITVQALRHRLSKAISEGKLVSAILDDGVPSTHE